MVMLLTFQPGRGSFSVGALKFGLSSSPVGLMTVRVKFAGGLSPLICRGRWWGPIKTVRLFQSGFRPVPVPLNQALPFVTFNWVILNSGRPGRLKTKWFLIVRGLIIRASSFRLNVRAVLGLISALLPLLVLIRVS